MKEINRYDIVVVGSGVGGGTFADYLTRRFPGIKMAVVEAGPHIDRSFFNQREIDMTALYFNRGSVLSKNLEIGVAAGKILGGSSAVYTGVSFRPPPDVLERWRNEYGLDFLSDDYVSRSLDEMEKEISVNELPPEMDNDNNKLFMRGAEALGIPVKRLRINIKNCLEQGFCNLGCTSGAKQGMLEVQIPELKKRGVKFLCNASVTTVGEGQVDIVIRRAPEGTVPGELPPGNYRLKCKRVVLAAGVLNTPAILLRSAAALGLKNRNTGRYVTLHPVFNVNGVYPGTIKNYRGFPKTCYTDYFSGSHGFYLETSFYFPGVTAKNHPGFGALHEDFMRDYHKMMSILILVHDQAVFDNRITIDKKGNPVLDYSTDRESRHSLVAALRMAAKIFFAAGCEKTLMPATAKMPLTSMDAGKLDELISEKYLDFMRTPLSSAHPQGGARMGQSAENAVCDVDGKVFGTRSVYVADASLFPGSVKVNPYETVMLLARHVAEKIDIS